MNFMANKLFALVCNFEFGLIVMRIVPFIVSFRESIYAGYLMKIDANDGNETKMTDKITFAK